MNFSDLIQQRRSVRKYADRPVMRSDIDRCLEAARLAPSACNAQPWQFLVVDHPQTRDRLFNAAFSGIYRMNHFVAQAPVIIVVIRDQQNYTVKLGGMIRHLNYSLIDIGITCDHLTLQAAELGLGTCWIGWFNQKAVKKVLQLPKRHRIDILMTMGYPVDETPKPKQRRNLDEIRAFFNENPE